MENLEKYKDAIEALNAKFPPGHPHWDNVIKFLNEGQKEADIEEKKLEMSFEQLNKPFDL